MGEAKENWFDGSEKMTNKKNKNKNLELRWLPCRVLSFLPKPIPNPLSWGKAQYKI